jgi:hypothetical protein
MKADGVTRAVAFSQVSSGISEAGRLTGVGEREQERQGGRQGGTKV